MNKRGRYSGCQLLFVFLALYAAHAQTTPAPRAKANPDCSSQIKQVVKEAEKKTREEAFNQGYEWAQILMSDRLSDKDIGPLRAQLIVEKFGGSDAYALAVAEIAKQHFADFIVIDPAGVLKIYVTGTNYMGPGRAQGINITIQALVHHGFTVGSQKLNLLGWLKLAGEDQTISGYNDQERAQIMREMAYKVLSDFRGKWTEAAAKSKTN